MVSSTEKSPSFILSQRVLTEHLPAVKKSARNVILCCPPRHANEPGIHHRLTGAPLELQQEDQQFWKHLSILQQMG